MGVEGGRGRQRLDRQEEEPRAGAAGSQPYLPRRPDEAAALQPPGLPRRAPRYPAGEGRGRG